MTHYVHENLFQPSSTLVWIAYASPLPSSLVFSLQLLLPMSTKKGLCTSQDHVSHAQKGARWASKVTEGRSDWQPVVRPPIAKGYGFGKSAKRVLRIFPVIMPERKKLDSSERPPLSLASVRTCTSSVRPIPLSTYRGKYTARTKATRKP